MNCDTTKHVDVLKGAVQAVWQFLDEEGFVAARDALGKEARLKSEDTKSKRKNGYLLSALQCYEEFLLSKTKSNEEVKKDRKLEEDLVNPKGGPTKPATESLIAGTKHEANVIDVRFCRMPGFTDAVASADVRGSVYITNSTTGKSRCLIKPGVLKAPILTMDSSPKHKKIAIGCMNGDQCIVNIKSKNFNEFLSSKDGKEVEVSHEFEKHGKYVNRIRWSSDGTLLATCSYDKEVRIYSLSSNMKPELAGRFLFRRGVECVEWGGAKCSLTLFVSLQGDNYIHTIDATKMKKGSKFNMNSFGDDHVSFTVLDLNCSLDGNYLLACTDKDRVIMFASNSEKQARNFFGADSGQYFNPRAVMDYNNTHVYGTSINNTIVGWDVGSQRIVSTLSGHKKMIRSLHVNNESNCVLASGSYDKTVRLWKAK